MMMTGGCLCGQVRYTVAAEPAMMLICLCKNCQKQGGGAFSVNAGVPAAAVTLEGELKTFVDQGESGRPVQRRFCGACGSPIFSEIEGAPGMLLIKAGTLDDASVMAPQMEFFCDSAQPWVKLEGGRKKLARQT
jgi:hypothetical protein